jgi:chemotaxis response regulator CheB
MDKKTKVLVVDDSFLMRKIISDIINSDPDLEVIGKAKDGQEALEKIAGLCPGKGHEDQPNENHHVFGLQQTGR